MMIMLRFNAGNEQTSGTIVIMLLQQIALGNNTKT